jgi:two-component system chemotaxis response regulator CheB
MNIKSKNIYTSHDKNQYNFNIDSGDVFLSILNDSKMISIFLCETDLNEASLRYFEKEARVFFGNSFSTCELKLIGTIHAINKCTKVFLDNYFSFVKRIIREECTEVIFIPNEKRIRISNGNVLPILNKKSKTKVLIVDDSKTIRTILNKILTKDPDIEVIGMLEKPSDVEPFLQSNRPDVITLDIHMPEMDGVTLLKKIYPKYKIPCVMISSISLAEGPLVFDALENGAVDYIQKPEASEIEALTPNIIEKIKLAATIKRESKRTNSFNKVKANISQSSLVVIGSSTGGTEALREILTALPDHIPPILIVQHIPPIFSLAFANRMNDLCKFEVVEATNGLEIVPNRVIIAPGGKQMKMIEKNGKHFVEINEDPPVNRFKPSVDYMFESVAKNLFCHTVAVMLTGMGKDGAKQMLALKQKGAVTIAQNEETCVVFGMPREAIAVGAVNYIEPLHNIAEKITSCTNMTNQKKVGSL